MIKDKYGCIIPNWKKKYKDLLEILEERKKTGLVYHIPTYGRIVYRGRIYTTLKKALLKAIEENCINVTQVIKNKNSISAWTLWKLEQDTFHGISPERKEFGKISKKIIPVYCAICKSKKRLEKHHIKPLYAKGTNKFENIIVLCKACHLKTIGREIISKKTFLSIPLNKRGFEIAI